MTLHTASLVLAALVASSLAGCTVTTGEGPRDATYLDAPPRTPATPRRKAKPATTPKTTTPVPSSSSNRIPATPVHR